MSDDRFILDLVQWACDATEQDWIDVASIVESGLTAYGRRWWFGWCSFCRCVVLAPEMGAYVDSGASIWRDVDNRTACCDCAAIIERARRAGEPESTVPADARDLMARAQRAAGLQFDDPAADAILGTDGWKSGRPEIDERGRLTGRIVTSDDEGYLNVADRAMIRASVALCSGMWLRRGEYAIRRDWK